MQGSNGETDRKQTYGHRDRGGEDEMHGENNTETYITLCKMDSQGEFAVFLRELKQGFWIKLEGYDGKGDGREIQEGGDISTPMADSCWCLTENNKIL